MALVLTNDVPRRWIDQPDGGGVTDHGLLLGLGDDDHPQYTTDAEVTAQLDPIQTALDGKRDALGTGLNMAYVRDGAGIETAMPYTSGNTAQTFMFRSTGGVTSVGTPTAPSHATTKQYTDDGLATKETSGAASAAITTHVGAPDPHTQYLNNTRGDARYVHGRLVAWNFSGTVATAANATEVIVMTTTVAVVAGRTYMVSANGELLGDNTGTLAAARLRYTTDGTAPTITSTILGRFLAPITQSNGTPNYLDMTRKLDITATGTLRVALTINREVGTTGLVQINSGVIAPHVYVFDAGPTVAAAA